MDKISYALGLSIGNNFRASGIKGLEIDDFIKGINDVFNEAKPAIAFDEAQHLLQAYFKDLQAEKFEMNKQVGEEFLRINKEKPGPNDKVRCHYHGTLIDGRVFDSSIERGQPAVFGVSQVIRGWTEALQLMNVGSKWRLFIPSDMAYGAHGAGEAIEPNMTLIFDVELLGIE